MQHDVYAENNIQSEICAICLDPMSDNLKTLQCNHTFHSSCINKWFTYTNTCPNCRIMINNENQENTQVVYYNMIRVNFKYERLTMIYISLINIFTDILHISIFFINQSLINFFLPISLFIDLLGLYGSYKSILNLINFYLYYYIFTVTLQLILFYRNFNNIYLDDFFYINTIYIIYELYFIYIMRKYINKLVRYRENNFLFTIRSNI